MHSFISEYYLHEGPKQVTAWEGGKKEKQHLSETEKSLTTKLNQKEKKALRAKLSPQFLSPVPSRPQSLL